MRKKTNLSGCSGKHENQSRIVRSRFVFFVAAFACGLMLTSKALGAWYLDGVVPLPEADVLDITSDGNQIIVLSNGASSDEIKIYDLSGNLLDSFPTGSRFSSGIAWNGQEVVFGRGTRSDNKSLYAMDIATGSISSLPTGPLGNMFGLGFDGEKFLVTTNEVDWFFIDGTTYINAGIPQYYYPVAEGYVGLGYGVGPTYGPDYYSGDWYIASAFEDIRVYSFVDEDELIVELIEEIPIGISWPRGITFVGNYMYVGDRITDVVYRFVPGREPVIIYVDSDGPGLGDGSNWVNAFRQLQDALADVVSGDEIRVAQGIYKPDQGVGITAGDRTATFQLISGLAIKGGYAGLGEPDPDARDIDAYHTILSGDLLDNDGPDFANNGENNYHVVTGSGTNETAILDGFTITGGNANGVDPDNNGAGMINYFGSPTLTDCTFSGNSAGGDGGGMYNSDGSPTMNGCTFTSNLANRDGGGMCNWRSKLTMKGCTFSSNLANRDGGGKCNWFSSPTVRSCIFRSNSSYLGGGMFNRSSHPMVKGCTFIGNSADFGGGMWNYSSNPTVTNCTFSGNSATTGGGIFNVYSGPTVKVCIFTANSAKDAGGMYNQSSSPTIEGCTFTANSATGGSGGGMYNDRYSGPVVKGCTFTVNSAIGGSGGGMRNDRYSSPMVTNCTFAYNLAPNGPAMACDSYEHSYPSTVTIVNSIIWNGHNWLWNNDRSTITVAYSDVQGGWPGEDNIDANPRFVDPTKGDYHLRPDSPCINAGDPDYIAEPNETDIDGKPRVIAGRIDMGAYEFNHIPVADAGPDQTVEAQAPWGATVTLDGSGSSDADSTPGTIDDINDFIWYEIDPCDPNADIFLGSDRIIDCNLPLGEHIISLEVVDRSGGFDIDDVNIIVQDTTPPDINCPPDLILECPADTTPSATGKATATDTCGTVTITHSDQWQPSCGNAGTLARTWTATDECGNSSSCVQTIAVVDTTPPEFEFSVSPTMLWPPNHEMVEITTSWTVSDKCDPSPDVSLVSIVANEGDDIIGDGHTTNDIQIGDDGSIYVRAERSGPGIGRIYTITYQAVDDCGNVSFGSATVGVPHEFKLLARMGHRWLWRNRAGNIPEDLNGDGIVNLEDFAILAENWIK